MMQGKGRTVIFCNLEKKAAEKNAPFGFRNDDPFCEKDLHSGGQDLAGAIKPRDPDRGSIRI